MSSGAGSPVRARCRSEQGFSLIELVVVAGVSVVLIAISVAANPHIIKTARADSGLTQALEVLRSARETAISQRRNVRIVFSGTNTIQSVREDVGAGGAVVGTTLLRSVQLENQLRFMLVHGVPDTPDLFGRTLPASFPASQTLRFSTEGTFMDDNGDPMNGTIFMAVPDVPNTARAITFFGPTALLRAWRWDGSKWVE